MKIVVEGYDASGKSTLAKALAETYGLSLVEAGPKPPNDLDAIADSVIQERMTDVVHSRITPISRQAYQLDNTRHHTIQLNAMVERFLQKGAVFIYCTGRAAEHVVKDYDTQEHLAYLDRYEDIIRQRYDVLFRNIDCIIYDFKLDDIKDLICRIDQIVGLS